MSSQPFIDVHVLQTVPPSNLNRDDAGTPKQAIYGGARRARVSSQAWKRATRLTFADRAPEADLATRTKRISSLVADRIRDRTGIERDQAVRISTNLLKPLDLSPGTNESETAYLLFLGRAQLDEIADLVTDQAAELAAYDDAQLEEALRDVGVRDILQRGHPLAVALFGRMVADLPALNVDAACQVAHAISTHPVEVEFDYYTAVDDEKHREDDEDQGAGMIGTVEFNSATLYRYATVGLGQLLENLGDDEDAALSGIDAFIDGFARSIPSGHQNSFAHRTLPSLVAVCVRSDQPVNLVSAFEEPVRSGAGVASASTERLATEVTRANELWSRPPMFTAATYHSNDGNHHRLRDAFGEPRPFPDLRQAVVDHLRHATETSPA